MSSTTKLKEQARRYEQREEWERAIEAYQKALRATGEGQGELELPLYNRIGDLYLRLGKSRDAVRYYEDAAEKYAGAGLYNNAIALCNKALRYAPHRGTLLHKLASYCGTQGFLTDSRRWFLEYAELQFRTGQLDEALSALEEFASTTDDPEIWAVVGERLAAHGRDEDAVRHLGRAYALHLRNGDDDAGQALRERILELDPAADLDEMIAATPAAAPLSGGTLEQVRPAREPEPQPTRAREPEHAADAADLSEIERREPAPEGGIEEAAATSATEMPDQYGVIEPSLISPEAEERWEEAEETGEAEAGEALPLLDEEPAGAPTEAVTAPDDVDGTLAAAEAHLQRGDRPGAVATLEHLHTRLAQAGEVERADDIAGRLLEVDTANQRALQARVEYAFRLADEERLVAAYLALAESLEAGGASHKARAVYQRVLELDSDNMSARRALYGGARRPTGDRDYVDLAGLVLDREAESSTRFVVPEEEPSGEEDDDFAEILAQFKAKVSESLAVDDPAGHYDLGLAYKEMGLIDEAIAEFQVALRGGDEQLRIYEELGQCFMLKEQNKIAVKVLTRATQLSAGEPLELLGVYYHLGRAQEALGNRAEAREAYERVLGLDIGFRDAAERLENL
ncbi:MAG: tetratricopeptide repeat protein [Longimicrobiales bacterium]